MKPEIKFGLIGGVVSVLVIMASHYFPSTNETVVMIYKYLVQVVFLVSIVAGIKSVSDKRESAVLETKKGMKAGMLTTLFVVIIMGIYYLAYQQTISHETIVAQTNASINDYFSKNPIKDTGNVAFDKAIKSYDSSFAASNWGYARYYLEKASYIRPLSKEYKLKLIAVNDKIADQVTSFGFQVSELLKGLLLFQVILGLFITFVTTMIFRFRQQSNP